MKRHKKYNICSTQAGKTRVQHGFGSVKITTHKLTNGYCLVTY